MTTPEIPEEALDAAARAVWEDYRRPVNARLRARVGGHRGRVPELPPWESLPEDHVAGAEIPHRGHFRDQVRPALEAAAPHLAAQGWDEGYDVGADWGLWTERTYDPEPETVNPYSGRARHGND